MVASQELVVYRSKDFPEYHDRIVEILNVDHRRLVIAKECDNALGLITSVESGAGIAIIAKSIMVLAGTRVKFVPFSKSHFLDVGLLYCSPGVTKSVKTLIAACAACREM
jgi:DNA-binding transcriptional LysR family regulator